MAKVLSAQVVDDVERFVLTLIERAAIRRFQRRHDLVIRHGGRIKSTLAQSVTEGL